MSSWKTSGENPDYRFTLANERTFLAWIRTGLGFFVAAVAIDQLGVYLHLDANVRWLAIAVSGISLMCIVSGYWRWRSNEIAMRHGKPLHYGVVGLLLVFATVIAICGAFLIL